METWSGEEILAIYILALFVWACVIGAVIDFVIQMIKRSIAAKIRRRARRWVWEIER